MENKVLLVIFHNFIREVNRQTYESRTYVYIVRCFDYICASDWNSSFYICFFNLISFVWVTCNRIRVIET